MAEHKGNARKSNGKPHAASASSKNAKRSRAKRSLEIREKPSLVHRGVVGWKAGVDVTPKRRQKKLGTWLATGLCGNDITSSCLYVAAIATIYAGIWAPLVLIMAGGVLYLYRKVYAEVGDALPLDGGTYNCLLNTTSKGKASMAACLTIISYVATAVISAKTAVEYASTLFPSLSVTPVTISLLCVFAGLAILGITESARAALVIFIFHMFSLVLFIGFGAIYIAGHTETLVSNWHLPLPDGRSLTAALFFGFCASLLGLSGFESSANFIEEQARGVFVKTLRNMWWAVMIFNPLIAFVALGVLPIDHITGAKNSLLADVGMELGGSWLRILIAADATLVLSGAVLTSFVGVTGLVRRMALDRCLPQFFLVYNKSRGTPHRIILTFLLLCVSIFVLTGGDLLALGGVYTIAFLSVMAVFALGNILLKIKRSTLPRAHRASWLAVFTALIATLAGIIGNIVLLPQNFFYFIYYYLPTVGAVMIMLYRHHLLRFFLAVANDVMTSFEKGHSRLNRYIQEWVADIESQGIVYFTKGDQPANINRALLYVRDNEITKHITVMHLYEKSVEKSKSLERDLKMLDALYPEIKIDLVFRKGKFSPEMINKIAKEFDIPKNLLFIGAPGIDFEYSLGDLGGVRVII